MTNRGSTVYPPILTKVMWILRFLLPVVLAGVLAGYWVDPSPSNRLIAALFVVLCGCYAGLEVYVRRTRRDADDA